MASPAGEVEHVIAAEPILSLRDATVVFDGFTALDVDAFSVRRNEMRVVIGPNGAGKTTLCDVISGKTRLTSGQCIFDGTDITRWKDVEIARRGVGRKFQTPAVFGSLTVAENLEIAAAGTGGVIELFSRAGSSIRAEIDRVSEAVGLQHILGVEAMFLSHGQRQLLEIGTLLIAKPKLLLIDEPAAGLTDAETASMAELLIGLSGHHTIVVIEHDMDFVRELGADVTVLSEGKVLAEGPMSVVQADQRVIDVYLGR
jgi:urea transport system ATP-binding protein